MECVNMFLVKYGLGRLFYRILEGVFLMVLMVVSYLIVESVLLIMMVKEMI